MKKLFLLSALLLAFSAASAQNYYPVEEYGLYAGTNRVEFYGGMVLPQSSWTHNGDKVDLGNIGWTAGLAFYRNISSVFALGLDGNYAQFGDGDKVNEGAANEYYYRTGAATGLVAGRINLFPRHSTRLYVPFGVGIGHTFVRQNKADGSHKTYSDTDIAGMLGAGLEFDMDETWVFGVEGRYYMVRTRDDVKTAFGKGHIRYSEIMLKLGCRF